MDFNQLQKILASNCPEVLSATFDDPGKASIAIDVGSFDNPQEFIFYQDGLLDCTDNDLNELPGNAINIMTDYLHSNKLHVNIINNGDVGKGDNHMENTYKDETDKLNKQLREDALKLAEDRVKRDTASGNSKKAKAYLKTLNKSMKIPAKPKKIDTQKIHKSNY